MVKKSELTLTTAMRHLMTEIVESSRDVTFHTLIEASRSRDEMFNVMDFCGELRKHQEEQHRQLEEMERELIEQEEREWCYKWNQRVISIEVLKNGNIDSSPDSCHMFKIRMNTPSNLTKIVQTIRRNFKSTDTAAEKLAIAALTIATCEQAKSMKLVGNEANDFSIFAVRNSQTHILSPIGIMFRELGIFNGHTCCFKIARLLFSATELIEMIY